VVQFRVQAREPASALVLQSRVSVLPVLVLRRVVFLVVLVAVAEAVCGHEYAAA
jgi:hypothetical protein